MVITELSIKQRLKYVCEQLEAWALDWSTVLALEQRGLLKAGEVRHRWPCSNDAAHPQCTSTFMPAASLAAVKPLQPPLQMQQSDTPHCRPALSSCGGSSRALGCVGSLRVHGPSCLSLRLSSPPLHETLQPDCLLHGRCCASCMTQARPSCLRSRCRHLQPARCVDSRGLDVVLEDGVRLLAGQICHLPPPDPAGKLIPVPRVGRLKRKSNN